MRGENTIPSRFIDELHGNAGVLTMRAVLQDTYGHADVMRLGTTPLPRASTSCWCGSRPRA